MRVCVKSLPTPYEGQCESNAFCYVLTNCNYSYNEMYLYNWYVLTKIRLFVHKLSINRLSCLCLRRMLQA